MRPYGLQYPELDRHPSDVYFFGDDLLVAPVVTEGARDKLVPFPTGDWYNWWTGERMPSNEELVGAAPLDTLPLYLRGGGIIPMLRPTIDTLAPVSMGTQTESFANDPGRLHVRMAPGRAHSFQIYDETTISHETNASNWQININPGEIFNSGVTLEINGLGQPPQAILVNDAPLTQREPENGNEDASAYWFMEGHLCKVVLPAGEHTVIVTR